MPKPPQLKQIPESKHVCTLILDLKGDECWFQWSFRRGAIHTDVDISEIREKFPCEVAASSDSIRNDIFWAFLCLFQFHVPGRDPN